MEFVHDHLLIWLASSCTIAGTQHVVCLCIFFINYQVASYICECMYDHNDKSHFYVQSIMSKEMAQHCRRYLRIIITLIV